MAKVFDYVIPLQQCPFMAKVLKKASDGDDSLLKWLLSLSITENPNFKELPDNASDSDSENT